MELTILIFVIIVIAKVVQKTTKRSNDYQKGYFDGLRDAQVDKARVKDAGPVDNEDSMFSNTLSDTEMAAPVGPAEPARVTVDDTVREKGRRTTINTALYTASLLLVAGILLLAQAAELSPVIRFVTVWLFIIIYYISGHVLYTKVSLLKPAATAFIGTALAALPIGGWSMFSLLGVNPSLCWFVTSALGVVLFVYATLRLDNQILAYISLLSLFIMATSLPAMMRSQLIWYYVVILIFGSTVTLVAHFSQKLPKQFAQPVTILSPLIVPLTLTAAYASVLLLSLLETGMLLLAGVVYYFTVGLIEKPGVMRTYELTAARVLMLGMFGSFAAYFFDGNLLAIGITFILAAVGNMLVSTWAIYKGSSDNQHTIVMWVSFVATLIGQLYIHSSEHSLQSQVSLILISLSSVVGFLVLAATRRPAFGLMTIINGWLWPLFLFIAINPPVHDAGRWLYAIYMAMAFLPVIFRIVRLRRPHITVDQAWLVYGASVAWLLASVWATFMATNYVYDTNVRLLYMSGTAAVAAVVMAIAMWRERVYQLSIGIHLLVLLIAMMLGQYFRMSGEHVAILLAWINAVPLLLLVEWLYGLRGDGALAARDALLYSTLCVSATIVCTTIHPAAWLPLVATSFYAFYRRRDSGYLVVAYLATTMFVPLSLHWLKMTFMNNMTLSAWLLLAGFAAAYWLGGMRRRSDTNSDVTLLFTIVAPLIAGAIVLISSSTSGIKVVAWLSSVAALYMLAYAKRSWLAATALAHPSLVLLLLLAADWLTLPNEYLSVLAMIFLAALYGGSWVARYMSLAEVWRSSLLWSGVGWSMAITLFVSIVVSDVVAVILATMMWLANGAIVIIEAIMKKSIPRLDGGLLLVVGGVILLIDKLPIPSHDIVPWYIWSVAALVASAVVWRWRGYAHRTTIGHLLIALMLCSVPTLSMALGGDIAMKLLFLIEHSLIVIVGLALGKRLITLWGATCVTLALIYMLSGYAYALAILAGLAIIIAVVIMVVRGQKS